MSMDTSFYLFDAFCVALGLFGLWAAGKEHKH